MKQADITLYQGADFKLILTIANSMGQGINITGYEFLGQVRSTTAVVTGSPVANFTFTILDQTNPDTIGQVEWFMPLATIATLPTSVATVNGWNPTPYIYDVKMQDASGYAQRLLQGKASVFAQVTQVPFT